MENTKIRLLFVVKELAVNGAINSLFAILNALPKEKYDVSLFLFLHEGDRLKEIPSHVALLPELLGYRIHHLSLKNAVIESIKRFRFDMIFFRLCVSLQRYLDLDFYPWSFLPDIKGNYDVVCSYEDGFVAPMIQRKVKSGKKCCWIHVPHSKYQQPKYVLEALKTTDACVTVSRDVGEDLNRVLNGKSSPQYIVHNIIDADTCKKRAEEGGEAPRKEGVKRIVSVGRVTPAKGFDIICPTAQLLKERNLQFEWYILGEGEDLLKFRQMAKDMNVDDCVHFVGNKSNPMPWVKSADVVVQPSTFESWGMTVSEALCLGKAVITSDLPVFAEQITEGVNGLMRPGKPVYMAGAITDLLNEDSLRNRLETNAKKYPFTKEEVLNEFENMVNQVLK